VIRVDIRHPDVLPQAADSFVLRREHALATVHDVIFRSGREPKLTLQALYYPFLASHVTPSTQMVVCKEY
jgi:hypothetical protein